MVAHRRWVEALVLLVVPAYVAQATLGFGWGPLGALQANATYRLLSGLLLAAVIGWMWVQSLIRSSARPRSRLWISLHRLGGLLGVGALFLHTTRWGHAYLTALAGVFLGTVLVGILSPASLRSRSPGYHRLWLIVHVVLAVVLVAGVAFHLWIGLSYA